MRPSASLRIGLIAAMVTLVSAAVIVVGVQAVVVLEHVVDEQALSRVEIAGLAGLEDVRRTGALDPATIEAIGQRFGMSVRIVDVDDARSGAGDAIAVLRGRAADEGLEGSARVDGAGVFVDVRPLKDSTGKVVALLETRLPTAATDAAVRQLVVVLVVGTTAFSLLAALVAFLFARRVVRPLESLARSATEIGRGDMAAPILRISGGEPGMLAEAMEEMRSRLLRQTSELRRRQAQAEAVLTGIVEGVWTVDRERRITWMNPQAAVMLGTNPEQALGRFCGDVLNPVLPDGSRPCDDNCPILDARFRGKARATEHLVLPDGRKKTVVITSAPPVEGQQSQVFRDETEVEAARRLRDAVLANVSHEFRTPLAAQLASLELLRERLGAEPAPEVDQLLRSAERGSLRLTRLIDNLLESLRIEAGRDSIRRQPVELDRVVEEAVELTAPLIEQKRQKLEQRLPWPLPPISGDASRLVQVFVNLLANANKFAPQASSVTIAGAVAPTEVSIWVEDEGPGLPEEFGERGFERFLRATGEEPEESGMGLGLWIVHSIVSRHGGRVDARNTGTGARVTVVLPRAADDLT